MKKPIRIETDRLILRDFVPDDLKALHEYAIHPKVWRFIGSGPNRPAQTRSWLQMARKFSREKPRKNFDLAIILKSENRLIGDCGIHLGSVAKRDAGMAYGLNPKYWGKGYATEASKALVQFGFSKLKLHRIWAWCDVRNTASVKVLKKTGMRREGLFRKDIRVTGAWRDSYLYAILASDSQRRH
jgi:ribosomal-protein-alanine N-acetyltransferase